MRIAIGCDDARFDLEELLKPHIAALGHSVTDCGVNAGETVLYPDIAVRVAKDVIGDQHDRAILICGTGLGVCISANKVRGIRAAQVHDTHSAERAQKKQRHPDRVPWRARDRTGACKKHRFSVP
jgi:ribose 5-phosphate isomerase B